MWILQRITERQNRVVITDRMWARLLSSTNQPSFLRPKDVIVEPREEADMLDDIDDLNLNDVMVCAKVPF